MHCSTTYTPEYPVTLSLIPISSLILQFSGKELASADLFARVKEIWTAELGRDAGDLKDVKLYVKPEETTAYYVINENITGSFEL